MSEEAETCVLEIDKAEALAKPFRPNSTAQKQPPSIKKIPYSLLCAEDIVTVVKETGLIAPFFVGGGRYSRIKSAAYEGRIGDKAYIYNEKGELKRIFDRATDEHLRVPQNQIVFVECDLSFRLPQFIALRFNLQIQHVHRGLLLGTGPLIDPGYWGKLCIPLHNLTDEDYFIPKDQGLIWLEFTKTTSSPTGNANPVGRPPLGGKFMDDIEEFLAKASRQYGVNGVPIRSALPTMFDKVTSSAETASENAQKSATMIRTIGIAAGLGGLLGILTLWGTYYSDMNEQFDTVRPQIEGVKTELDNHIDRIEKFGQDNVEAATVIPDLRDELRIQKEQNAKLDSAINRLKADVKSLKPCRKDPNRPDSSCLP